MPAYLDRWIQKAVNDSKGSRQQKQRMTLSKQIDEEQAKSDAQWAQWKKDAASPEEALKGLADIKTAAGLIERRGT